MLIRWFKLLNNLIFPLHSKFLTWQEKTEEPILSQAPSVSPFLLYASKKGAILMK